MGRQTIFTAEIGDTICREVKNGLPVSHAAALAGVSRDAVEDWSRRGQQGEEAFAAFSAALARARAVRTRDMVGRIRTQAMEKQSVDWKAEAWLLERLEPDAFTVKTKTELTGANGGPVEIAAKVIMLPAESSPEAWTAAAEAALKAKA